MGKFFFNEKNYSRARQYFEKSLAAKSDDIEAIELLLYTYEQEGKYNELYSRAVSYLDIFPTHARLYYYAGLGANKLQQYGKAKEWLESGIDFVVEDKALEANFKKQLEEAKRGKTNTK